MTIGFPRSLMSNPLVVKIPEPIILAMTMLVKGNRPSLLSSSEPERLFKVTYFSEKFRRSMGG